MAAFTLVSFLAALNGYLSSMDEAEKLLDRQLRYAIEVLMANGAGSSAGPGHMVVPVNGTGEFAFQVWRDGELQLRSARDRKSVV